MRAMIASMGGRLPSRHNDAVPDGSNQGGDNDGSLQSNVVPVMRLRAAFHGLDALPEAIVSLSTEDSAEILIGEATLDQIAVAIVAANALASAASSKSYALEKLYRLAWEAGAAGNDLAVEAALKREGR